MLAPKKVKHRKWQRGDKIRGKASRMTKLSFGDYGLKSLNAGWITARQIESARRTIVGHIQRIGDVYIRLFPDKPITAKGNEMPMGKGKGAVDHYVAPVKPGTIMFEMKGVEEKVAKRALQLAGYKLPVKTKFITKKLV
ncbi:MAG: 50S ribosomal protein L16 [Candidatus Komeilibacteria bacterium CG11_big_fil_rev_8_21_14_0_20_36_20]|uniref:Large ribosomal subunit protein uL16 n=1 Tax=Candidatus Komeilibacteria bacterium CG11_big_fil_rev_8_21_14_0_20_36_20 TaxID=1974477 RepID=A0A2H0NDR2_9BACT|nr:MAG: 50S ribosomal protein L16 [Candidatus Komeilibacteria bacterium CG11_big_fil_rev_8_21_14_0_20_36_20]PIR81399.1 MAG: 50S ribosomal protein L16 [Candidatus Komeilibacteria bacterium CG10_big_fil_rev_8_21_14_0_10_36_65]PJC55124.1 MAG: 50S ribosomal protein L16 [Candidatus Komeilibacteria bacterium CG_4_9_14_0_2_um_filter_36_13]